MLGRSYHSSLLVLSVVGACFLLAGSLHAEVPTQVPFQGLLLDSGGTPVNDAVDLDFELFDAITNGNGLWTESHLGVTVVDGVYAVNLGSQTPLTQSILSGGVAFLEITVSGETLVPRQQLLAVPYALVAESVGSISAQFLEQVSQHFPFDGQAPPNDHPDEGMADTDLDGVPNFLDRDNDDDGVSDASELALGRPINIVDPTVQSISPNQITSFTETALTVTGLSLDTVSSVSFGAEQPTPELVTPTSFVVNVSAETTSTSETLSVTLANGQSAVSSPVTIVAIVPVPPTIESIAPFLAIAGEATEITITGTGFVPGTTVQVGSQNLVPSVLSATEITVTMAGEPIGLLTVTVTHPNLLTAEGSLRVVDADARLVFLTSLSLQGGLSSVSAGDAICQLEADQASLPGTYRAWLSESLESTGTQSPATTFPSNVGPYLRPDFVTVADDWSDLTDGTLQAPIAVTAAGATVGSADVWTGTNPDGTARGLASETCQEWSTNAAQGIRGRVGTNAAWTLYTSGGLPPLAVDCGSFSLLYCFQQ